MKKLFTLLFCMVALSAAANTQELIDQCIHALLTRPASPQLMAVNPNLDADGDGELTIADVTTLIDQMLLAQKEANRAPAQKIDVDALARQAVRSTTGEPNVNDVNEAIETNLKNE